MKAKNLFTKGLDSLCALWSLLLAFTLLTPFGSAAQELITIKGVVKDSLTNNPLPQVSIKVRNATAGITSGEDGSYSISVPVNSVLEVSAIGFVTRAEAVDGRRIINWSLQPASKSLEEVVVVGYGTQNKKSLISAVASVKADEIKNKPVASFDQQLQGKVAGVQVAANTGVPGDGIFFRIRGTTSINASNEPLYVVDGVFINNTSLQRITTQGQANNPLADINPSDIENITILKDATATAIYGARAANGVVLITTKRGAFNTQPKVSLSVYAGRAWAPELWDLVSGPEHATIQNEAWVNSGGSFATRPFRAVSEGGRGLPEEQQTYDRLHDIFRTASLQNYDLSVAGGNDKTRYYVGGGYTAQEAIVRPNNYQRGSFKVNLDQGITDRIRLGVSNSVSRSRRNNARVGDGPAGGMLQAALHTPTYLPKNLPDGTPAKWAGFDNLGILIDHTDMQSTSTRYIGNLFAEAEFIRDLKFKTSWSLDYNDYDEYQYWNSLTNLGATNKGYASSSISRNTVWVAEQTLSYRRRLGNRHTGGVLLGNSLQSNVAQSTLAEGTNFPNDSYRQIASAATQTASSRRSKYNLVSYFSRLDYSYGGKYFAELNVRADASSKFGAAHQWGYFPSAGVSWRLKEEPFLKTNPVVSELKIRANIGLTGNQNGIGDFASRGLWGAGLNYNDQPGTGPQQLENPELKWETTRQANVGVDLGLWKDRISIEFNLYEKYTTGLLLNAPLAAITGYTSITSNGGEMSNRGFELSVNSTNLRTRHVRWLTSLNLARNRNKIEKLPIPIDANYNVERMIEGYPVYSFYMYRQLYVDPQTGDAVFDDRNKDGQITAADRQVVGDAWPSFFGGLTNTFTYKGFDAALQFNFQWGNKVFNANRWYLESGGTRDDRRAMAKTQLGRWQKPGDVTDVPRVTTVGNNNTLSPNSRFLEDGSFMRLGSLNIGYSLPRYVLQKIKASGVRFYVAGSNLWLWKNYLGPDPEINVSGNNQSTQAYDLGTPPQPRVLQVGAHITF